MNGLLSGFGSRKIGALLLVHATTSEGRKALFRFIICILFMNIVFQSCNSEKQKDYTELKKQYGILWSTPDDSLTNEQKSEKLKLTELFLENLHVQDSLLVFLLSKEDFVKQGFPEAYYDLFIENIQSINDSKELGILQEFIDSLPGIKKSVLNNDHYFPSHR
jgi:hypothetical protein